MARAPFFQRHLAANLGDGLTYREANTPSAAHAVVAHLINDLGLEFDQDSAHEAAPGAAPQTVPEADRLVYVYRQTSSAPAAPRSDQTAFARRAA